MDRGFSYSRATDPLLEAHNSKKFDSLLIMGCLYENQLMYTFKVKLGYAPSWLVIYGLRLRSANAIGKGISDTQI